MILLYDVRDIIVLIFTPLYQNICMYGIFNVLKKSPSGSVGSASDSYSDGPWIEAHPLVFAMIAS